MKQKPFYQSVKKMLGIFNNICFWGIQFYVVKEDTAMIVPFIIPDVALITAFFALKKMNFDKKDKGNE